MYRILSVPNVSKLTTRGAKAVAKKRYIFPPQFGGVQSRTGKLLGAYVEDGEPVRRGDMIWNENKNYGGPWECCPGSELYFLCILKINRILNIQYF